jgi:hypothetical protein
MKGCSDHRLLAVLVTHPEPNSFDEMCVTLHLSGPTPVDL